MDNTGNSEAETMNTSSSKVESIMLNMVNELKTLPDSKACRTAIETLLEIFRNVMAHPDEQRYRQIRTNSQKFERNVWQISSARSLFLLAGWKQHGEFLKLVDDANLQLAVKILVENRVLSPSECTFKHIPVEGPGKEEFLESELRKMAIKERDQELSECLEDKRQRKELAEIIKQEHAADRQRNNLLFKRNSQSLSDI